MSESGRGPCNGIARLLAEADPGTPPAEILAQRDEYECPSCGWAADLHRQECMVCEYDQPLTPTGGAPSE